jgi:hypothetical protein
VKTEVTYTEFTAAKSLTATQASTIMDKVMRVMKPAGVRVSRVEPRGLWDPSAKWLHATHTGAIIGYMEFQADSYPVFAFVFFFRNGHWSATVVVGDQWTARRKEFHKYYRDNLHELQYFDTMGYARMEKVDKIKPDSHVLTLHMRVARGTGRPHLEIKQVDRK